MVYTQYTKTKLKSVEKNRLKQKSILQFDNFQFTNILKLSRCFHTASKFDLSLNSPDFVIENEVESISFALSKLMKIQKNDLQNKS